MLSTERMENQREKMLFLILQFLDEEKYKETVHKLQEESGVYFDMNYFSRLLQAGEWDKVEMYLKGFTKVEDNRHSTKIFFEIRKQKFLEALDKNDRAEAVEILVKDLKVFAASNAELYKEMTELVTLDNFRQKEILSSYVDAMTNRSLLLMELKKFIESNPIFKNKLTFPPFKASRLRTLLNQSLNWQHRFCNNHCPNPDLDALFTDHTCATPNSARPTPAANEPIVGPIHKPGAFPPITAHRPNATPTNGFSCWIPNSLGHAAVVQDLTGLVQQPNAAMFLKRPRTPTSAPGLNFQPVEPRHRMKRIRAGRPDEVSFPVSSHSPTVCSHDYLPKNVLRILNQGSSVMCLDFHPQLQSILLVGTSVGDIGIWDVGTRERISHKPFNIRAVSLFSTQLQTTIKKDDTVSANRCLWSPVGSMFGVAFSKHIVQTYSFMPTGEIRQHLEIDAHVGGVNDIAFGHPNKRLSIITCGDDKTIKVWDAATGLKQYVFEGHGAPVYSVCPRYKETQKVEFIISTAKDGKIKAWLYDSPESLLNYDAPGLSCTTMAYSADGSRLFSCGTSEEGEPHLIEWDETEGTLKRTYSGLKNRSSGVIQFDTNKNRLLAAGDDFMIKFWDMDYTNILGTTDADGGLPASPKLRFNKDGSLLAVNTSDNGIKILGNSAGQHFLRMLEANGTFEGSRALPQQIDSKPPVVNTFSASENVPGLLNPKVECIDRMLSAVSMSLAASDNVKIEDVKTKISGEIDKVKLWKLAEVTNSSDVKALRLPDSTSPTGKAVRLLYTNSGKALLSLFTNAIHKLWKWQRTEKNPSGKSTALIMPQPCQSANGIVMTNVINDNDSSEESTACIALSKNEAYFMSASGGMFSLFNRVAFKIMASFMSPPPAATSLLFHPHDNNIVAIGLDDSTIQIYDVRTDEVISKLQGHENKVTGLAFSESLNVLVSSGMDSQLCVWSIDGWEKIKSRFIQAPDGRQTSLSGDTNVLFHNDQTHFLVTHKSHISIYDCKLECLRTWSPRDAPISSAVYSCDGLLVYAGFCDGAFGIFDAETLTVQCRVSPSAYMPQSLPSNAVAVYPMAIAAHPAEPGQIALGMSNGDVYIVEPSYVELKLKVIPSQVNGAVPSISRNPFLSAQASEHPAR